MQSADAQTPEVDNVKDFSNPVSLVNITPSLVSNKIAAIPDEVLLLNEEKLEHHARVEDAERRLRAAFQLEHEVAIRKGSKMDMTNVYKGIVTFAYFHKYVVGNSYKLAYMIKPYTDYKADMEDLLRMGLDDLRVVMKRPLVNSKGELDHKLAMLKHSITKDLLDRTKGSATKHIAIDSKSMNVNINKEVPAKPLTLEEVNEQLKRLEAQEAPQIEYKDVTNGKEV